MYTLLKNKEIAQVFETHAEMVQYIKDARESVKARWIRKDSAFKYNGNRYEIATMCNYKG